MTSILKPIGFWLLVVAIVLFSVFPFYYAIISSLRTGQGLFDPFKDLIDGTNPIDLAQNTLGLVVVRDRNRVPVERVQPLANCFIRVIGASNDLGPAAVTQVVR